MTQPLFQKELFLINTIHTHLTGIEPLTVPMSVGICKTVGNLVCAVAEHLNKVVVFLVPEDLVNAVIDLRAVYKAEILRAVLSLEEGNKSLLISLDLCYNGMCSLTEHRIVASLLTKEVCTLSLKCHEKLSEVIVKASLTTEKLIELLGLVAVLVDGRSVIVGTELTVIEAEADHTAATAGSGCGDLPHKVVLCGNTEMIVCAEKE